MTKNRISLIAVGHKVLEGGFQSKVNIMSPWGAWICERWIWDPTVSGREGVFQWTVSHTQAYTSINTYYLLLLTKCPLVLPMGMQLEERNFPRENDAEKGERLADLYALDPKPERCPLPWPFCKGTKYRTAPSRGFKYVSFGPNKVPLTPTYIHNLTRKQESSLLQSYCFIQLPNVSVVNT